MHTDWFNGITIAITVSDADGNIIEMNDASAKVFAKYGGRELIGQKLNNFHNPNSIAIMGRLLSEGGTNVYTIEKNGQKKLIFQAPWHDKGEIAGLIEFSFILPDNMPHFKRD